MIKSISPLPLFNLSLYHLSQTQRLLLSFTPSLPSNLIPIITSPTTFLHLVFLLPRTNILKKGGKKETRTTAHKCSRQASQSSHSSIENPQQNIPISSPYSCLNSFCFEMENPLSLAVTLSLLTLILMLMVDPSTPTRKATKQEDEEEKARPNPQITVMGMVYCDFCSNNTFSRHSYFIPGVEVKVECKFKVAEQRTAEEIAFTVNRTTNRYGIYRLEIPAVDGIECAAEPALVSAACQASLLWSSSPKCNVPGYRATSDVISIKARKPNLCIYSLNAMTFRPSRKNKALCGN